MSETIRIRGGAGAQEVGAITAAVMLLLAEEEAHLAAPIARPELSSWATDGRFRGITQPRSGGVLPSGYSNPFRA